MKTLFYFGFLVAALGSNEVLAQEQPGQKDAVEQALAAREYVFHARNALPQRGRSIFLDGQYDLTVSKDSVVAYLPYFGRAYTAPLGSDPGGIQFTSTDFAYTVEKKRKKRWEIRIKPNDIQDVQELYLSVSKNGFGSLQVTSTNRQAITFNGELRPR